MSAVDTIRDAVFGNPPALGFKPSREGVLKAFVEIGASLSSVVTAFTAGKAYASVGALNADLSPVAGTVALVYADSNAGLNGFYAKIGASGSGPWQNTGIMLPINFTDNITYINNAVASVQAQLNAGASAYGSWLLLPGNAGKSVAQYIEALKIKGDPGGNSMSVGLFTSTMNAGNPSIAIPVGTDLVQTSGYSISGNGAARYAYDPAVNTAYVTANPRTSFYTTNGRGFKLAENQPSLNMFGAIGDGTTDDTSAIQAAINSIGSTGLYAEGGRRYVIMNTISLPRYVRIYGDGTGLSGGGNGWSRGGIFETYCNPVFIGATPGTATVPYRITPHFEGVSFIDRTAAPGSVLFNFMLFDAALVKQCLFYRYNVILRGVLAYVSRIIENTFLGIYKASISNRDLPTQSGMFDSYILNNYFNNQSYSGLAGTHVDIINGGSTNISHNYFDFSENCIKLQGGGDINITENIFDYSYRGVYARQINNLKVVNNKVGHCNKIYMDRFPGSNPGKIGSWAGFEFGAELDNVLVVGNEGSSETEQLIMFGAPDADYVRLGFSSPILIFTVRNIKTRDNSIVSNFERRKVVTWQQGMSGTNDGQGNFIEEMQGEVVSSLPSSNLYQGFGIVSFDRHIVKFKDRYYINNAGTWKDYSGARYGSASPSDGFWQLGDIQWHTNPAPGGFAGWITTTAGGLGLPAWGASSTVFKGRMVTNGGNVYRCAVGGQTAASGGPTGTGSGIVDGTVTWDYMGGTAPVFKTFGVIAA